MRPKKIEVFRRGAGWIAAAIGMATAAQWLVSIEYRK